MEKQSCELFLLPTLTELCLEAIAFNFKNDPLKIEISSKDRESLLNKLPLDIPLETATNYINEDIYWKRRFLNQFQLSYNYEISSPNKPWKQRYFEANLSYTLENFNIKIEELKKLIKISKNDIKYLNISQLPSHLDLNLIFDEIEIISNLILRYDAKDQGMSYDIFNEGMTKEDSENLAGILIKAQNLIKLDISNNNIDDNKLEIISKGLNKNKSIKELNLNKNKISGKGIKYLIEAIKDNIEIIKLNDNNIDIEGANYISHILLNNKNIKILEIRANKLGDEGCEMIINSSHYLKQLNIGANQGNEKMCNSIINLLENENNELKELDVTCNTIDIKYGIRIKETLILNRNIESLKIGSCGSLSDELESCINENLLHKIELNEKNKILKY